MRVSPSIASIASFASIVSFALALLSIPCGVSAQTRRDVRIPLNDGRLSVLGLTRALLNEYGFGGDRVRFRDLEVDVSGAKGSLLLAGIGKALGRTVRFEKQRDGNELLVRIDRARTRALRHKLKDRLGRAISALVGEDILARRYELSLPDGLGRTETFVLCIHGVDSSGRAFADLRRFLAAGASGIRSGTFTYANDEAIDRIGEQLAAKLKSQKQEFPERHVILVAHSMGGLVARYVIENEALDPGNVTALIMLGTPNHGSRLARLRPGLDALEFLKDHGDEPKLLAPWLDGLGEAGWDLRPDSPFLAALNAKPRNRSVAYHLILGDKGVISPQEMASLRESVMTKVSRLRKSAVYGGKIEAWLADVHEVVQGEGDGAVSLERGKLDGVREVIVRLGHDELLDAASSGAKQPAFELVRKWVVAARKKT